MFACIYRVRRVLRMEIGGRFNYHRIQFFLEQPLVPGQPGEARFGLDFEFISDLVGLVLEVISAGDELIFAGSGEQVCNPRATPAAANEADLELGILLRTEYQGRLEHSERTGSGCAGEESTAGDRLM
jgi:hypothetical protein